MSERKKERSPRRRIGKRRNSSKPLAGTAKKKRAQRARAFGPEYPIRFGSLLYGYLVFAERGYEALTAEKASLGLFPDPMSAVHAIFEQFF
jgi:hypothetical protein